VKHTDGRTVTYGELAPRAATLPLPTENPPLKDPKQWRILGTRTRVVDTEDIVTGRAHRRTADQPKRRECWYCRPRLVRRTSM